MSMQPLPSQKRNCELGGNDKMHEETRGKGTRSSSARVERKGAEGLLNAAV